MEGKPGIVSPSATTKPGRLLRSYSLVSGVLTDAAQPGIVRCGSTDEAWQAELGVMTGRGGVGAEAGHRVAFGDD